MRAVWMAIRQHDGHGGSAAAGIILCGCSQACVLPKENLWYQSTLVFASSPDINQTT